MPQPAAPRGSTGSWPCRTAPLSRFCCQARVPFDRNSAEAQGIPVVAVLLSGRPLWVNAERNAADAFIAAWLPGSKGGGVAAELGIQPSMRRAWRLRTASCWPMSVTCTTSTAAATAACASAGAWPRSHGVTSAKLTGPPLRAQRADGELLSHARGRARSPGPLCQPGRGQARAVCLSRRLRQPPAAPLGSRPSHARAGRAAGHLTRWPLKRRTITKRFLHPRGEHGGQERPPQPRGRPRTRHRARPGTDGRWRARTARRGWPGPSPRVPSRRRRD
jgi:hypothetical protein